MTVSASILEFSLAVIDELSETLLCRSNTRTSVNLTHHFLLSMPQMHDTRFEQSLIYILEHDAEGAWGVVINQTLDMTLQEVFDQLDIATLDSATAAESVYSGGPVDSQHGLVLHRPKISFESTRHFDGGVSLSSSRDVLEALAAGEEPEEHLVLLGHAGWGPGQLEDEVADNAWLTCEADTNIIFNTPVSQMRAAAAGLIGIDLGMVVGQSGRA